MKKFSYLLISAVFVAALVGCSAHSGGKAQSKSPSSSAAQQKSSTSKASGSTPLVMKVATVSANTSAIAKGMYKFKQLVEQASNGSIKVQVFANGQLGTDQQLLQGLQLNTIQAGDPDTLAMDPVTAVTGLPFIFKDRKQAYKILDGPIGHQMLASLSKYGLVGIDFWEVGFRQLTNNKEKITSLRGIKGLKIRTAPVPIWTETWKYLGANPTPIAYTELYTALQQGVVQAEENPVDNIVSAKFYEVQKYLTIINYIYSCPDFALSKKFWNTLSSTDKAIITKAANEAMNYERKVNQESAVKGLDFVKKHGMTVSYMPAQQLQKMRDAIKPLYASFEKKTHTTKLINEILNAETQG